MIDFIKEFTEFLFHRKKFWLIPLIVLLMLISLMVVFTQGTALAPFIYTIF